MRANSARIVVMWLSAELCGCPQDVGIVRDDPTAPPPDDPDWPEAPPEPRDEVCGNGLDEDLDGWPDDECDCAPGDEEPCYPGPGPVQGACAMGVHLCEGPLEFGSWGECLGAILPSEDVCNDGIDQDCDGRDAPCGDDPPCDGIEVPCPDLEDVFTIGDSPRARPVDLVWAIDQSSSMDDEIEDVRDNLNGFADAIAASGLDYHVVVVAKRRDDPDDHEVCIPPPLAGAGCADAERFRQIDVHVDSNDALDRVEANIDEIEGFLREGSLRVFTVVTDDESDMSADQFDAFLRGRDGYDDWVFSGFVGIDEDVCDDIADEGRQYVRLADMTGGDVEHVCSGDWALALDDWAEDLAARTLDFELAAQPAIGIESVEVDRGGGWVPLGDEDWDFEPPRTIHLSPDAEWAPGDRVRVIYE
ncbi:MAG: VWA domain-containing protein [Deltaproteobacteria bacterium]|nr:VWA domain-containing protein [Deltaproteobacteria bacterium]